MRLAIPFLTFLVGAMTVARAASPPGVEAEKNAVQTRDGKIHVIATSERRTVIGRYTFDESAVVRP